MKPSVRRHLNWKKMEFIGTEFWVKPVSRSSWLQAKFRTDKVFGYVGGCTAFCFIIILFKKVKRGWWGYVRYVGMTVYMYSICDYRILVVLQMLHIVSCNCKLFTAHDVAFLQKKRKNIIIKEEKESDFRAESVEGFKNKPRAVRHKCIWNIVS